MSAEPAAPIEPAVDVEVVAVELASLRNSGAEEIIESAREGETVPEPAAEHGGPLNHLRALDKQERLRHGGHLHWLRYFENAAKAGYQPPTAMPPLTAEQRAEREEQHGQ